MAQNETTDAKRIAELSRILNSEDDSPVRITPDGRVVGANENIASEGATQLPCDDKWVMQLWRECDLPEWFLSNQGTNYKLTEFANRIKRKALIEQSHASVGLGGLTANHG